MKQPLQLIAFDQNESPVLAKSAREGECFFCPICRSELGLGNDAGQQHFEHQKQSAKCTPKKILLHSFKKQLAKTLQQHIDEQRPLEFSWSCAICYGSHKGNLMKKVKSIALDYQFDKLRPDIALLDGENRVFAVIEVTDGKKMRPVSSDFHSENNIIFIEFDVRSELDVVNVESKISKPRLVNTCFSPKCPVCGNHKQKNQMYIIEGDCWKCDAKMKIAVCLRGGSVCGPDEFSTEEIEFARSKGVILREQYSHVVEHKYLANSCTNCGKFVGDHYLFTDYFQPAEMGQYPLEIYDLGYYCDNCSERSMQY